MRVSFLGEANDRISVSSHHARALADGGVEIRFDPDGQVYSRADASDRLIHVVSCAPSAALMKTMTSAIALGIPVVRYWTNRSVLWAKYDSNALQFARTLAQLGAHHAARSEQIAETLRALGLSAGVLPVLSLNLSSLNEPTPLPAIFTALCRLPRVIREFHGGAIADRLIPRFSDVRFLILGDPSTDYSGHWNVESLGAVEDVGRSIKRSTVLVEPRLDGGLSRLALEMLSHGRHVISTHSSPLFRQAKSFEEFAAALRALRKEARFNLSGRESVCQTHDQSLAAKALLDAMGEAHEDSRRGMSGIRRAREAALAATGATGKSVLSGESSPHSENSEEAAFRVLEKAEADSQLNPQPAAISR